MKLPLIFLTTLLIFAFLYVVVTQLTSVIPVNSSLFNGVDLRGSKTISGERLEIERFVGILRIENNETLDQMTLTARGTEADLEKLEVRLSNNIEGEGEGDGEVNIDLRKDVEIDHVNPIELTIQMPKKKALEVHLNKGQAWVAERQGLTELFVDGKGTIETATLGNALAATIRGSGRIAIGGIQGMQNTTIRLKIAGEGVITLANFHREKVNANVSGNGKIDLQGIVTEGDFTINGNGEIRVAQVAGPIKEHINGSGKIIINEGK